jgi:mycothiol synthase
MTIQTLPGFRLRPYRGEPDLVEIARIENLESEADDLRERTTTDGLAARYRHPNESFDPARDVTIAEVDGRPVAVATREWVDTTDGYREYRSHGAVDPDWRRRGIGSALLADNEQRHRRLSAAQDVPLPRILGSWSGETQAGDVALLEAAGYDRVRWFFKMNRASLDEIPTVALPDGLEIRAVSRALAPVVWAADIDSFKDHWGGFDHSDEVLQRWLDHPSTDLDLWVVAFDGEEVAGGVINAIDGPENDALGIRRGWLASVFTRRAWRRRGLARALIARSLERHRDRGMTSAGLGVDAENPSGALGLYEGLGFEVEYRSTAWRKPLDPGARSGNDEAPGS